MLRTGALFHRISMIPVGYGSAPFPSQAWILFNAANSARTVPSRHARLGNFINCKIRYPNQLQWSIRARYSSSTHNSNPAPEEGGSPAASREENSKPLKSAPKLAGSSPDKNNDTKPKSKETPESKGNWDWSKGTLSSDYHSNTEGLVSGGDVMVAMITGIKREEVPAIVHHYLPDAYEWWDPDEFDWLTAYRLSLALQRDQKELEKAGVISDKKVSAAKLAEFLVSKVTPRK